MTEPDYSGMLDELLAVDDGLRGNEVDFIEDMANARRRYGDRWRLTPKQQAWLARIYDRRFA
ncbi:MAG: hypothetical protein GX591_14135 [Planctomycetes bacterium]|nr:hypothetical protein [Planctomycetota bacterium]